MVASNTSLLNALLAVGIIVFVIMIAWSKIQHQRMSDTLAEIKEMIKPKEQ